MNMVTEIELEWRRLFPDHQSNMRDDSLEAELRLRELQVLGSSSRDAEIDQVTAWKVDPRPMRVNQRRARVCFYFSN